MEIKGISNQVSEVTNSSPAEKGERVDFLRVLKDAIDKVDSVQKEADESIQRFAQGKASLHETMIAIEKASLSFQLMVQVRNKIVAAYEDIMRMQV